MSSYLLSPFQGSIFLTQSSSPPFFSPLAYKNNVIPGAPSRAWARRCVQVGAAAMAGLPLGPREWRGCRTGWHCPLQLYPSGLLDAAVWVLTLSPLTLSSEVLLILVWTSPQLAVGLVSGRAGRACFLPPRPPEGARTPLRGAFPPPASSEGGRTAGNLDAEGTARRNGGGPPIQYPAPRTSPSPPLRSLPPFKPGADAARDSARGQEALRGQAVTWAALREVP